MKKIYIMPLSETIDAETEDSVLLEYSQTEPVGPGEQGGNQFSKGTDASWDDEDDEDK